MSAPFTENLVGSWVFTRSTHPGFTPGIVYHFTADGKCYWEVDIRRKEDVEEKRVLTAPLRYRFADNTLTFIYPAGTEHDLELNVEDDGSVGLPTRDGFQSWMVRLSAPEPWSKAFVDEHGRLQKLGSVPQG